MTRPEPRMARAEDVAASSAHDPTTVSERPATVDDPAYYAHEWADMVAEILADHFVDSADDPADGVEAVEALLASISRHPEVFARRLAHALRRSLPRLRVRARLCPECGGELVERRAGQWHPYGATMAYESWTEFACPVHGPVDDVEVD
ncbi:MAG TPA: hypothetical protein VIK75_05830 [Calditerricola sp.]